VHKECSSDIRRIYIHVHDTHEERAPIIDGLGRALLIIPSATVADLET